MDNRNKSGLKPWYRRVRLDLRVLRHVFPWRTSGLLLLGIAVLALLFHQSYHRVYDAEQAADFSYIKAIYAVLNMAAFQVSYADMPPGPALDIYFIIVPLVSLPLLLVFGANLFHVVRVFFVREERGQTWQRALAATVQEPIVLCGLGHVGYRVAGQLLDYRCPVVGIDAERSPLTDTLMEMDMPVILGDVRDKDVLESAGVQRASTVVICTHNDLANIEAAFHVREANPKAQIILRLFEDKIAGEIQRQFQIKSVLSRSAIAAQAFAYAALGIEALETFTMDQETYVLAEMPLAPYNLFIGDTVKEVAERHGLTIVCLYHQGELIIEPPAETTLQPDDMLFIFTDLDHMPQLTDRRDRDQAQPIVVFGLGHTGYRVVNTLRMLKCAVAAVDLKPGPLSDQLEEEGVPVTYGDVRRRTVMESIGLARAGALITCAEDDMLNFEIAIQAREIAPEIRVVMRIFEEGLGQRLQQTFNINAVYSTSAIAAPAFVAAALDIHLNQPVKLGEADLVIARMTISTLSGLFRETVDTLTRERDLTILLHKRESHIQVPPNPKQGIRSGDEVVVLASRDKLRELGLRNQGVHDL